MMTSLLLYLDRAWEITVFPHPNAPGIAQVPPWTSGKRLSRIRWPVTKGVLDWIFSTTGRGLRTGHRWDMVCLLGLWFSSSSNIMSSMSKVPLGEM